MVSRRGFRLNVFNVAKWIRCHFGPLRDGNITVDLASASDAVVKTKRARGEKTDLGAFRFQMILKVIDPPKCFAVEPIVRLVEDVSHGGGYFPVDE